MQSNIDLDVLVDRRSGGSPETPAVNPMVSCLQNPPTNLDAQDARAIQLIQTYSPWFQVFGSFMIFINIWGFTFVFGMFQSFYEISYIPSESSSSISWIGTIQSALLVFVGVLAGPLYDLGLYRSMLMIGAMLFLLGVFTLSLSTSYYSIFLSQGICVGLGGGLLYVPSLALVSRSFKEHRAVAMSIVTCGIGLGGVIYTATFQSLLPRLGFPWTVRVLAFIALGVFALSVPTLILSTNKDNSTAPTQIASAPSTNTSRNTLAARPKSRKLFDVQALRDHSFLAYSLSSFLLFLGYLVPFFYIPSFAQLVLHTSTAVSFWALAVSAATSIFGRLSSAYFAQKFGVMATWTASAAISGALCLSWIAIDDIASFFAFCGLYGFFSGSLVALPPSIFPRICTRPERLGTWMGMGWVSSGVAFLIGAPIAGALLDTGAEVKEYNFRAVQLWSGILLSAGTGALLLLWRLLIKKSGEGRIMI